MTSRSTITTPSAPAAIRRLLLPTSRLSAGRSSCLLLDKILKVGRGPPQSRKQSPYEPQLPWAGARRSLFSGSCSPRWGCGWGGSWGAKWLDLKSRAGGGGWGRGAQGALSPPASPFAPVAAAGAGTATPPGGQSQPLPPALARGGSHFYGAVVGDRLFRFCRLRQFAPTFRLKLPFFFFLNLVSFLSLAGFVPYLFSFFLSSSFATTAALTESQPQNP